MHSTQKENLLIGPKGNVQVRGQSSSCPGDVQYALTRPITVSAFPATPWKESWASHSSKVLTSAFRVIRKAWGMCSSKVVKGERAGWHSETQELTGLGGNDGASWFPTNPFQEWRIIMNGTCRQKANLNEVAYSWSPMLLLSPNLKYDCAIDS